MTSHSSAQSYEAIDITSKGVQVGEKAPNVIINNIHNYETKTANLYDFKGKMIILDFWATWCSPCLAMRPKLELFQKQFKDKIVILSVTYQPDSVVSPFLQRMDKGLPSSFIEITADKILHKLFPHNRLPHYVWLDSNFVVRAITSNDEVTAEKIEFMLKGNKSQLSRKMDIKIPYKSDKSLLIGNNGGDGSQLLVHSLLTKYTDGLSPGLYPHYKNNNLVKITALNVSFFRMLKHAYGEGKIWIGDNRTSLEVADISKLKSLTTKLEEQTEWYRKNGYCYEIQLPENWPGNIWTYMQEDLARYFPEYSAGMKKRKTNCLVLIRTSKADKLKSSGGKYESTFDAYGCKLQNASLWEFFVRLNVMYMQNSKLPLVNEAGYDVPVDMVLNCNLSNIEQINTALKSYDLKFVTEEREIEVLVISDKVK